MKPSCLASLLLATLTLEGALVSASSPLASEVMLADFDDGKTPSFVKASNATVEVVPSREPGEAGKALDVRLHSKEHWVASVAFRPDTPWDWSAYSDFHVAFDVSNHGDESVQIDLIMSDKNGDAYTRVFVIPVGGATTVYAKMDGHDQTHPDGTPINEFNFVSGMRSNPPTWESEDRQVYSLWGKKSLDLSGIVAISFNVSGNLSDRYFTVDNLRLRPNPEMDANCMSNLVDRFGQNTKVDYPSKVRSEEHLKELADEELASLSGEPWPGRTKYHGWAEGPQLEATGFFRTEKVDGKWWLVDPEGRLFFTTGIDIIRLSNSSTVTGYDFDHDLIPERDANEIVSEDDQPLNRVPDEAVPSRRLASKLRADLFSWLPGYDDPMGKHYGYRRTVQSGPVKRGESYSFYSANLERRYGDDYMSAWREATIKRMIDWGYTSFGNWVEDGYYKNRRIPFFAFADINGDFKTLESAFDFWHPLPDPYDPVFYERALVSAEFVAGQIEKSPWCIGIFYDNEQSFGRPESDKMYFGLVTNTLELDAKEAPCKAAFTKILKVKYGEIGALNEAWRTEIASWEAFAAGVDQHFTTPEQRRDYSDLLYAYGKQYFGTIRRATKSVLPNHLYLGARMADWGRPTEIVRAAAEESDVLSFNLYEDGVIDSHWEVLPEVDRPTLIGEFSFGATDRGHFHPGVVVAADQQDRGRKYIEYMHTVLDNPYLIGAHMFQYMDGPITGRAYDGENYNTGIVSVTDIPYWPLVEAVKHVNHEIYTRRYGGAE
ncbi:hypothetical protein MalM25_23390 [Planctomycetes bacterium MalM25]|nr:hypothetical protein MalM25_23390 [Planctomycetes bacterium MalM25]